MITLSKKCVLLVYLLITYAMGDVLEAERSSFFGFTHEIPISTSTLELVQQLTEAVMTKGDGDRRVRRYYQRYDTPFTGPSPKSE